MKTERSIHLTHSQHEIHSAMQDWGKSRSRELGCPWVGTPHGGHVLSFCLPREQGYSTPHPPPTHEQPGGAQITFCLTLPHLLSSMLPRENCLLSPNVKMEKVRLRDGKLLVSQGLKTAMGQRQDTSLGPLTSQEKGGCLLDSFLE